MYFRAFCLDIVVNSAQALGYLNDVRPAVFCLFLRTETAICAWR